MLNLQELTILQTVEIQELGQNCSVEWRNQTYQLNLTHVTAYHARTLFAHSQIESPLPQERKN